MSGKAGHKTRRSFGATAPPFLDYLKDILCRYPDGGQILKELIQNADDAHATKVTFIHDERSYGTESLWNANLGQYQGPALYAYNNAAFTENDWERIQKVGRSDKINDPNKIGRFGIGFNSVYHITDVPSIFSSGHLGMMDPQEKIFGERNGGFLWSLDDKDHQEPLMTMHDQIQPYRDIVSVVGKQEWSTIIKNQYFSGTLFRFPLRNKASEISDNLYNSDKVVELFDSFIADADLSLLFLKSVSSVSLIHISQDGTINPRLEIKSSEPTEVPLKQNNESDVEGLTRIKLITLNSEDQKKTQWLLTTCTMKEGKAPHLDDLAKKLSFLPRVDLAFPLGEQRDCGQGRLSCFLPLPNNESNKTGLPVYVNACFGLTDNRRHIKWQEEDQKHDEHALWNELLVKKVLPQAYVKIIQDAIKLCQQSALPVSSVYSLWPDVTQMQHKDKWFNVAVDVFHHLFNGSLAVFSLARDETQFISLSEAVIPCDGPMRAETLSALKRTLVSCRKNLVSVPATIISIIRATETFTHTKPQHVTPHFLREVLHTSGVDNISNKDKLCILEFILSDGKYKELEGLQLLPLSDGSFKFFTKEEENTALIDNKEFPRTLLPYCNHLFIPYDLSSTCRNHLEELAKLGLFQVINTNKEHVEEYTRKCLPQDWKQMEKRLVTWNTNRSDHPPLDWLQEFWRFLNFHFSELSCFREIPLIPVSSLSDSEPVSLAKLQQKTTLIFQKRGQNSLPDQIAQLVTKSGGTVVRGNEWLKHEDLETYVLNPSPGSVLKLLMNLDSEKVIRNVKSESQKTRENLKDYLSHLNALSGQEKNFLINLPVFPTMTGILVTAQSKQALVLTSGLVLPSELPVPDSIIQCATEADRRLLQLLKVKILGPADVGIILIDSIKNRTCSSRETENIMTWILQHGDILFSQNQSLKSKCKELRFIEVKKELKRAADFLNPTAKAFKMIFESDVFPPPIYTESPQMLKNLIDLGLINKEADLTPKHVLYATTLIEQHKVNSESEALTRAEVLLEMLDGYDLLSKFSDEQLNCLKMVKWIPCDQPGPEKQNRFDKSTKSCFCSSEEIRHTMYEDIVGEVMPLMGKLSDRVNTKFGLKRLPPPEKVIENLSILKSTIQDMDDPDTNVVFKRKLHSIYGHMQQNISEFAELMNKEPDWLWANDQFVSPCDLVLNYPQDLDLSSYIGKVPNEFLPFKKLLQKCGLRTALSNEEIVDILHSIQQNIEAREQPIATSGEVKVSIEILSWLWKTKQTFKGDIPVPVVTEDEQFTLRPQSEALLCDVNKNKLKEIQFSEEKMYLLHEEIPIATAEWLKIRFLSNYILAPELIGIEQCGQSEPITIRIKNILKEYDEDGDIFKELIQNAEDAGADVCKFLLDFREHKDPPESLIDPDMALCQGSCLWAFNNERFTDDDWKNIVRVGSASKENKVEKIGKFGLGFNTVYHVTDVPSILSGSTLLILDPNVTHLGKHIQHKANPGIKIDLSQKRLFHCFPGLFGPYEDIFDCNFTQQCPPEPYDGTLIRLPFRSEEEAQKSEISKKVYHKENIIDLQQNFTKNSQVHLLFLRNINMLSLKNISSNVSTPLRDEDMPTLLEIVKTVDNTMRIVLFDETFSEKQQQAEQLLMRDGIKCTKVIDSSTVQIVQLTSKHFGETAIQSWVIYNCLGTDQSLKMVLKENKTENEKTVFSLPIGGVAMPLQQGTETGKLSPLQTDFAGQAFCFLPLPIQTGLPVNINGTFAVMSNRKGLWESGVKHKWNMALQEDPVVTAYITSLLALKQMSESKQLEAYCYHSFWPEREKVSDTFKPLVDAFYFKLVQSSGGLELFSDGEHWCSMNNAIFLHECMEENAEINKLAAQVCKKYIKAPNIVVSIPLWLRKSFKQARQEKVLQNKTWTWEKFYQEVVFKNLATMDTKTRDTLVLHAVDLNIKEIDLLLTCYPCIPTSNGQLQYIRKLVHPSGRVTCLFQPDEGRLLGGTKQDFRSPRRIQRLLELGMTSDHLPLEDITHKACTMTETWSVDKKKAYENVKCLLELMEEHLNDKDSPHWKTLRMTPFLPAFSPGVIKMNENTKLQQPTAIFSDRFDLLVNMIHPVLDHSGLKIHNIDPVLDFLKVQNTPEPKTVLQQLQEACKHSQSLDTCMLHKVAYECYKFLDQWISGCENATFISEQANSFPFVLIGNTFVNVNCVAENEEFEAKPYLHVLPHAFTSFRNLWETVGVGKNFTTTQFLSVLQELHSQHENKVLPERDLSICLTILTKGIFEAKEKPTDECLIPNVHGVLQPAKDLFYDDSPWMPVASGITLCHQNIPRPMAIHFGIQTTMLHTLENSRIDNFSPFSFHFEQQEKLTVRIKNIISAYPSKKDILKELIQNADDAEATEIHFIWDKRQHGKERTFGENWNNLQGPALCVFNNKVFSDDDLKGIQQLGEGGKQNLQGKIGKYGLGFNSVYHLTDCPSILTGDELLCISDPNQKYIESPAGKPRAGIGYKLVSCFKEMYTDVYESFLPDKFTLKEGTMFRLPLRTNATAKSSNICQQEVTEDCMSELFSVLSEEPEGLILFLKHICKIEVHELDATSQNLKTILTIERTLPQESRVKKETFAKQLQNARQSKNPITPCKTFYEMTVSTSDKSQSEWIIAEQFGSFKNGNELKAANKLPQGAIAAEVKKKRRFSINTNNDFQGAVFCSLPLPGKTGLPVHVNGNFEVDTNRKNLWKEDGQSVKSNWNESLKQLIIAPLYADLLHYIRDEINDKKGFLDWYQPSDSFLRFWPTKSKNVGPEWHDMMQDVYRSIKENGHNIVPVLKTSTRKFGRLEYCLDWCNLTETDLVQAPYLTDLRNEKINLILEGLGMKLVPDFTNMDSIWKSIQSAGIEVKEVSPATVRMFLQAKSLNDPAQIDMDLPLPVTATLIQNEKQCSELLEFCLNDSQLKKNAENDSTLLDGLPLLLTKDKVLQKFNSKSPKLISRYDKLFFGYEDKFADHAIHGKQGLLKTLNLVKKLTLSNAAEYLKPIIQSLLQDCEVNPDSGLYVPNEKMLKWLEPLWFFITSEITPETSRAAKEILTIKDVKELFSDCCILPVVHSRGNNKHFLQAMKNMSTVIPYVSEKDVSPILCKLGFVKLNLIFFSKLHEQFNQTLCHELLHVNDKVSVLDQACKINQSDFRLLSSEEMKMFQNFLQSEVSMSEEYKRKLKSLPIFETTLGERVRIDGPQEVFIFDSKHSVTFPHLFTLCNSNNTFLKFNPDNFGLSEMLEIKILSDLDYFMKFIIPFVQTLTEKETLDCLKLILLMESEFDLSKHKKDIILSLKSVKLIRSSQGQLETASYYYDNSVKLYEELVSQQKFVPETFWADLVEGKEYHSEQARKLIRELGMKHKVTDDEIISFAHQLESEAKENRNLDKLKQKSKLLFTEALKKVDTDKNERLLRDIADIKFIFPVKIQEDLCNYYQPFASENATIQIRGSLIETDPKHQDLIWSSMPIIHLRDYVSQNLSQMITNVGAHKQPPSEKVTTNMKNICQSPCKTDEVIKTRADVFRCAYAYLQANGFDGKSVYGLPIVLVEKDTVLFKSDGVCLSLSHDLEFRPYLYSVSSQDALYAEFFKKVGVKEKATAEHYCNVLAAVYADSCDKKQLNGNQLITVKRAVHHLFLLIQTQGKQALKGDDHTLYLPAVDGKLHTSSSLYYNDTIFEIQRLEEGLEDKSLLLEKLSECHLDIDIFKSHQLVKMLPQKLQPKMLSQITAEKVMESSMKFCELEIGCEFKGWFNKHLSSEAFKYGVVCLLREQSGGQITQREAIEICEKTFGNIHIVCCKSLKTMLWLAEKPLLKTARDTDAFVIQEHQGLTLYLEHHDDMTPKVINKVNMTLTKGINVLLGHRISSVHLPVLGQLLMCDDLQDVQQTLADNYIHDSVNIETKALSPPDLGTNIPDEWHNALDMSFLNNFEEGEFVGYSTNNKYIYAVIVKELPGCSGRCSWKYKIDIGKHEPVEVSHLDLYQFKREKKIKTDGINCTSATELVETQSSLPTSLEEAKREIDKCLAEIGNLSKEERRKAIRRLYLRWHPDKNFDCQDLTTEAFKYLQNQINKLNLSDSSGSSNFSNLYPEWDQEARHHRSGRENVFSSKGSHSYNIWTHNTNIPRANKAEAKRWCKQARCDLDAAHKDKSGGSTEWCLFKVHQAVEKALMAAEYNHDGKHTTSSSISARAAKVSCYHPQLRDLPQIVADLKLMGVDAKKTQYPNCHPFPHIPNEQFRSENGILAVNKASELLNKVEVYVN